MTDARVPRRHCLTWLPSAIFDTFSLGDGADYTQCLAAACPDDFFAVRVGLANVTDRPWVASRLSVCPSSTWSDRVNPEGGAGWTPLTFAHGGADSATIAAGRDLPLRIEVAANRADPGNNETANPAWTWTDWTPVRSLPRTDIAGGPRILMLRMLVPPLQTITFANGAYFRYAELEDHHRGFVHAIAKFHGDAVSDPGVLPLEAVDTDHGVNSIACVQFLTRRPGITAMVTGDSHHAGASTETAFSCFLLRAMTALGAPLVGRLPLGYASCACGGLRSPQFFDRLMALLPVVRPGLVVLPGWSFNDQYDGARGDRDACDIFFARLLLAAEACAAQGAVPIYLTPFPRDPATMTAARLGPWHGLREAIMAFRQHGGIVLDTASLLGRETDGVLDGTYRPEYSNDEIHPNDAGHERLAAALMPLIQEVSGLL